MMVCNLLCINYTVYVVHCAASHRLTGFTWVKYTTLIAVTAIKQLTSVLFCVLDVTSCVATVEQPALCSSCQKYTSSVVEQPAWFSVSACVFLINLKQMPFSFYQICCALVVYQLQNNIRGTFSNISCHFAVAQRFTSLSQNCLGFQPKLYRRLAPFTGTAGLCYSPPSTSLHHNVMEFSVFLQSMAVKKRKKV